MARILFIDDETHLMQGVINHLKIMGHEPTIKTTGYDALSELRRNHGQYDLVILDLLLPYGEPRDESYRIPQMVSEKVGEFIFEKMEEICRDMPVIISTAARSSMNGMREAENATIVTKPILLPELLRLIHSMIGR